MPKQHVMISLSAEDKTFLRNHGLNISLFVECKVRELRTLYPDPADTTIIYQEMKVMVPILPPPLPVREDPVIPPSTPSIPIPAARSSSEVESPHAQSVQNDSEDL